jgi:hypothetical protein
MKPLTNELDRLKDVGRLFFEPRLYNSGDLRSAPGGEAPAEPVLRGHDGDVEVARDGLRAVARIGEAQHVCAHGLILPE